jgi:leucyl aminopeptidase
MTVSFNDISGEISNLLLDDAGGSNTALPVWTVASKTFPAERGALKPSHVAWLEASGWKARPGAHALLPGAEGLDGVVLALGEDGAGPAAAMQAGGLPGALPDGTYYFPENGLDPTALALAWAMGAYSFNRYLKNEPKRACRLVIPKGADRAAALAQAQAVWVARELINIPANDLGPQDLASAVEDLGQTYGARVTRIEGDRLLHQNFPMIHAVGRASDRPPTLTDLVWGDPDAPKVTLVGKGICFDTGGLNIKPAQAMALMKKDMGGAAAVIALGAMIMAAKLPVRLRILVPAADNSISASSFRPGDILKSRNGMTVEIGNTDAEGRLVLADALALAEEDEPDLLINMATLTGSARVALGPDLPAYYTDDETLAERLYATGLEVADPMWRMPFWMPYDNYLKSKVADVNHIFSGPFAGSITAALFLKRFVKRARRFVHLDIFAWMPRALPGKPAGGEPQCARALFEIVKQDYGKAA